MRIKLDENIAASAAIRLIALGHDVHTVIEEELSGLGVWQSDKQDPCVAARSETPFIRKVEILGDQKALFELRGRPDPPDASTWGKCFVVATPNKVRVRRPSGS